MYNIYKPYEENYALGPDKNFLNPKKFPKIIFQGQPQFSFLDEKFYLPFGVPAGPLLNSKYINCALDAGFCFPIYKTVRSQYYPCHPFPNIVKIKSEKKNLFADEKNDVLGEFIEKEDVHSRTLSISNSFGVPSQPSDIWQNDFLNCQQNHKGYSVGISFQGTNRNFHWNLWKENFLLTAELACQALQKANAKFIEVNLSCPNENAVPLYKDFQKSKELLAELSKVTKPYQKKLIAKIGVVNLEECKKWIHEIPEFIDGLSVINTVSANILNSNNDIILGSKSKHGGICGNLIRQQGLMMVESLANLMSKLKVSKNQFGLIGVGGIMTAQHVKDYLNSGAHVAQSATGMMWNLNLAKEVSNLFNVSYEEVRHHE